MLQSQCIPIQDHPFSDQDRGWRQRLQSLFSRVRMFVTWMSETYISNGGELPYWDFINLKKEDYNHYCV